MKKRTNMILVMLITLITVIVLNSIKQNTSAYSNTNFNDNTQMNYVDGRFDSGNFIFNY